MQKYLKVIEVGIQNSFVYRYNFFIQTVFQFVPLITTVLLWSAAYEGKAANATIADYTLTKMIGYYILAMIASNVVGNWWQDFQISEEIRNGQLNKYLLKPVSYLGYRLSLVLSNKLVFLSVVTIPLAVGLFFFRYYLPPPATPVILVLFVISLLLTLLMNFLISFCIGLISFWMLEVSTLFFIFYGVQYFLSGGLFPLDLLPKPLYTITKLLPFYYQAFFPVSMYMGKFSMLEIVQAMLIQLIWVIIIYLIAKLLWYRGLKRYAAAGG
ncbi:MAG: ABC-2 family transporter protein [bacterium]|nr:ABC-2 family transporter protein [bacterium]